MDKLQQGLKAYQKKVASGEIERTETTHNWIVRAKRNPSSLKTAIGAMCFNCMGGTEDALPDPGWKELIATCTAPKCPLHSHRPYRNTRHDWVEPEEMV